MKNMFLKYAMERNKRNKTKRNKLGFFPEEKKNQENIDFFFSSSNSNTTITEVTRR